MASTYSFAEKKRIRKSFEKISSAMSLPDILEIQTDSYDYFLQNIPDATKRKNQGLESVFQSIFPINSVSGNARGHTSIRMSGGCPYRCPGPP